MDKMKIQQWIQILTGVATVLGLFFNVYFSYHNKIESDKNFKIIKTKYKQEKEDRLKEQSNKVGVWLNGEVKMTDVGVRNNVLYRVKISNRSDLTIYNVFIFSTSNRGEGNFEDIKSAFENMRTKVTDRYFVWKQNVPNGITELKLPTQGSASGGERPAVSILFTDQNGHGWYRNINGRLSRHDDYMKKLFKWGLAAPDYKLDI